MTICTGTVISAGSIINQNVRVGKHAIINTGAIVDHYDLIGAYANLVQGVVLGGNVTTVGDCAFIDTDACLKRNTNVVSDLFWPGEPVS